MKKHNFKTFAIEQLYDIEGQGPAKKTDPIKVCLRHRATFFDRVCEKCDKDHGFRPSFEKVKTSIKVILLSMQHQRDWEGLEEVVIQ